MGNVAFIYREVMQVYHSGHPAFLRYPFLIPPHPGLLINFVLGYFWFSLHFHQVQTGILIFSPFFKKGLSINWNGTLQFQGSDL